MSASSCCSSSSPPLPQAPTAVPPAAAAAALGELPSLIAARLAPARIPGSAGCGFNCAGVIGAVAGAVLTNCA
jgi:hypothetical protein